MRRLACGRNSGGPTGPELGLLTLVEALALGVLGGYYFWQHMHPLFAIIAGSTVGAGYYALIAYRNPLRYVLIGFSILLWGGAAYFVGKWIWPSDHIWHGAFVVFVVGLAVADKKAVVEEGKKALAAILN